MRDVPGFKERVRGRILAQGFIRSNGDPDVLSWSLEKRWTAQYIYKYLNGTTPDYPRLIKLCDDLGVTPGWLLFGDDLPTPTGKNGRRRTHKATRRPERNIMLSSPFASRRVRAVRFAA